MTVQSSGNNLLEGASVLENAGTLTMTDGSVVDPGDDSATQLLNDAGATIVYNGSSGGTAQIEVPFEDSGAVNVGSGTLDLDDVTFTGSPSIAGPGTVSLDGTATLPGTLTLILQPRWSQRCD
jgi:hypothetical protein